MTNFFFLHCKSFLVQTDGFVETNVAENLGGANRKIEIGPSNRFRIQYFDCEP